MKIKLLKVLRYLIYILVSLIIFLLTLCNVAQAISPVIANYANDISSLASTYLNYPISVKHVRLHWHNFLPAFVFQQLQIFDSNGKQSLLNINEVIVSPSLLSSLWSHQLLLYSCEVKGINVTVIQNKDGSITLKELPNLFKHTNDSSAFASSILNNIYYVALQDIKIKWQNRLDEKWQISARSILFKKHRNKFILTGELIDLDFDKLFYKPIHLSNFLGKGNWNIIDNNRTLHLKYFEAQNADLFVAGSFFFKNEKDDHPIIDLNTHFILSSAAAYHIHNYLPLTLLKPELVKWLTHSIIKANSAKGKFILHGRMKDFPYINDSGKFLVESEIDNAELAYAPNWPSITNINGKLIFYKDSMQIYADSANIMNTHMHNISAEISKLGEKGILKVKGGVNTDAQDGLRFIYNSPLKETIGKRLAELNCYGPLDVLLNLQIPLNPFVSNQLIQVNGKISFKNNNLYLPTWKINLQKLNGNLNFTQEQIKSNQLSAELFGKPVSINVATPNIVVQGQLPISNLPVDIANYIIPYLHGETDYKLMIKLSEKVDDPFELTFNSSLKGIEVKLPEPLSKAFEDINPLSFTLKMNHQQLLKAIFNYADMQLNINKQKLIWLINVEHPWLSGQLEWPENIMQKGLKGKFNYFRFKTYQESKFNQAFHPQNIPPLKIEINDFSYNERRFGAIILQTKPIKEGMLIQKLQAITPDSYVLIKGTWIEDKLAQEKANVLTRIQGKITTNNIAKTLENWKLPKAAIGKRGNVDFKLFWLGQPYAPDFSNLNGLIHFKLEKGSITNFSENSRVRMDIGRLLTSLSVQSLTRRIRLDFSDLTNEGLSFNDFSGNFKLINGLMTTNNLKLEGDVADVNIIGNINLSAETYNLQVSVIPHLTSSLPIVATIAGGPIIGAATWAANQLINPMVEKITMDNYLVTGTWDKPVITTSNHH